MGDSTITTLHMRCISSIFTLIRCVNVSTEDMCDNRVVCQQGVVAGLCGSNVVVCLCWYLAHTLHEFYLR